MVNPGSSFEQTVVLEHPMPHTKFQGRRPFGSGEDCFKVFTIYGHGSHLGHVTWTPRLNKLPRRLNMKFGFNRPSGFREDVWKCWHTHTHTHTHIHTDDRGLTYPISSPKVNQVIYPSSPISWPSFTPLAQMVFEISCWQVLNAQIFKGP